MEPDVRSAAPEGSPSRRRSPAHLLLRLALVVALAGAGAVLLGPRSTAPDVPGATDSGAPTPAPPSDRPTPADDAAPVPLGTPVAPPAAGGPYRFAHLQADGLTPVAYDPCRPVHYVTRPVNVPAGGEQMVRSALARITEVTGLRFVDDGTTDEPGTRDREPFQPARYGDRWAPVLIAWETEAENPDLAGDRVGEAGSTAVSLGDGPKVYVTGTVSLDATQLPDILTRPGGAKAVPGIVLHEFGHLVGLDHVDDDQQLMYPETRRGVTDFAAGDITGLVQLGAGVCVPAL